MKTQYLKDIKHTHMLNIKISLIRFCCRLKIQVRVVKVSTEEVEEAHTGDVAPTLHLPTLVRNTPTH